MVEKTIIVGFGSKITDTTVEITDALLTEIKNIIIKENHARSRAGQSLLPFVSVDGKEKIDPLYPIFKKVIERHKRELKIHEQEGGSVFNSFSDARVMLGDKAKNFKFVHFPTAFSPTIILVLGGKKIMATHRPEITEKVVFTPEQKIAISKAAVFFAPKSSFNGYAENIKEIFGLLNKTAKIFATFHGGGVAKNIELMQKADIWAGNQDELNEHIAASDAFGKNENKLLVITNGEHGLDIKSGKFQEHFSTLPVKNFVNDAGAGNGVEGTILAYMLGVAKGNTKEEKLTWLGNMANAAGGVVLTFIETALKDEHLPLIEKRYGALVAQREGPEPSAKKEAFAAKGPQFG